MMETPEVPVISPEDGELITLTQAEYERAFYRRPRKASREIYFLRAVRLGTVKIGVADDPAKRLRGLALTSPDKLRLIGLIRCDRGGALEREIHSHFADIRLHGEWFKGTRTLLAYIAENAFIPEDRLEELQACLDEPNKPKGRKPKVAP